MDIFGDVLFEQNNSIPFEDLQRILKMPVIKPRYKISILNPDETVKYEIPPEDILEGGISYTESLQNGQRRNITLQLINNDGEYTPSINNNIWLGTKIKFDVGVEYKNDILWFPRGVYVLGDVSLTHNDSDKTVTIQLKDKFSILEDKTGTLQDPYEIPVDSNVEDVLKSIMNFDIGNGYILDYKPIILDPSFVGFRTQATIRCEQGENIGKLISELATQMSAVYYYNNNGCLCFYKLNETLTDESKPIIWTFDNLHQELHNLNLSYANENVINTVQVVSDNIDYGTFWAIVSNENPSSPLCVAQIGKRLAETYNENNVWNNQMAEELARYYLKQNSFLSVSFDCTTSFNPIFAVDNIIEVENNFLNMKREKLLITSISFSSNDGAMSLKLCNTSDLPSNHQ